MPDATQELLGRVRGLTALDNAHRCWAYVIFAIEHGWLDADELRDVKRHLGEGRSIAIQDLLFDPFGDMLRVRLHDHTDWCTTESMLRLLALSLGKDNTAGGT
jgi:hypothetical protein